MVKVKICGITRFEDLEASISAGADFVGFVVNVPSSPRNLDYKSAARLISTVPSNVKSVAVTVLRSPEDLRSLMELGADYVQLHGELNLLMSLAPLCAERAIGAVNAKLPNALELALECSKLFGMILVDSLRSNGLGGSGEAHDWGLSRIIRDRLQKPIILAGGLTPDNVATAVKIVNPYAVDVSTGVEASPGIKDSEKVSMFIKKAKEARV
jgi:phosphoribosylanthranilate isomerase